ncbi:nucleotidyl transferase [Melioribacter roseus P3M-2]|uniref:Nucleotidyl transferase n=1 Tax=Melioribacter roseus (strain DSM 23840 / JCM 17771 / VKM B-2668 / P3M-2) TaxID=1191523 RepID=I7A035_MELRP|nr:sugar phosphate nucleotidyltransferase [Melioribacter roseus]AFN74613.1 nucleotidyl transferase [Melioribacter roseus P3M-2]
MRAVIPAAGFGTRLKPHTHSLPKVMLNVGGKPIIGHIVDKLIQEGINKATFIIGYMGEKIVDYINGEYPLIDARFVEQEELLGLGHAIYVALKDQGDEDIFIILGDTIFDFDLKKGFEKNTTALGVKQVEDPSRFGVAVCQNDTIVKLIEKPQTPISKLALVGLYYIKNTPLLKKCLAELIDKNIRTRGEYQLTDALQLMIDKGEVIKTFDVEGWYDCGKPETLLETNRFLLSKNGTHKKFDNAVVIEPVYIDDKAEVINSVIGPYATISKGCKITDSIIRNSIIGEGAVIDKSMLENSIIGSNAAVKGNFKKLNTGDSSEIEYY